MTFDSQNTVEPQIEPQPRWTGRRKPRARSAIANGRKLIMADGRSMWAKRFTEICAGHCNDLGGFENLSQAELAIIKRAATLQVELEYQETRLANGDSKGFDLATFAQVSNGLRRLLETIGIKRVARDVSPSIADIVALHNNDSEFVTARAEQERLDELQEEGRDTRTDEPVESQEAEQSSSVDSNLAHAPNLPTDDSAPSNVAHVRHLPTDDSAPSNTTHVSHLPNATGKPSNLAHGPNLPEASNSARVRNLPEAAPSNRAHAHDLPASDDESGLGCDQPMPTTERAP